MAATAFLSMWVSNTAAVMMMIPMGLAITAQVASALKGKPEESELPKFEKALILELGMPEQLVDLEHLLVHRLILF